MSTADADFDRMEEDRSIAALRKRVSGQPCGSIEVRVDTIRDLLRRIDRLTREAAKAAGNA